MDLQAHHKQEGNLDLVSVLVIAAQILKGLIHAKNFGIEAHQDLKPTNILLQDLSEKYANYPPDGLSRIMRYRVRLADFGLANAYKDRGMPKGSTYYMAPEQFKNAARVSHFKPDIFALGVIMTVLRTGLHPYGKAINQIHRITKGKPWEELKRWTVSGDRQIATGSAAADELIFRMLAANPVDRPTLDDAMAAVFEILAALDVSTYQQVKLQLDYYDALAKYEHLSDGVDSPMFLAQLPGQLDVMIDVLTSEEEEYGGYLTDSEPIKIVYYLRLAHNLCRLLLQRNTANDAHKAREYALFGIEVASRFRKSLTVEAVYPSFKFGDSTLIETPDFADFETFANFISDFSEILTHVLGAQQVEEFFGDQEAVVHSAFRLGLAGQFYGHNDFSSAFQNLDQAIQLNPDEPTFYYRKAMWLGAMAALHAALSGTSVRDAQTEIAAQQKDMLAKAVSLNPQWSAPQQLLQKISDSSGNNL